MVEVAIPRRVFELGHAMPPLRPGYWPPVRVVSLRMVGQGETVVIEPLTPTSLWVRIWRGPNDPENLTWRWRALAQRTGAIGLSLALGARTIGPEGVGQEALWPKK